MRACVWYECVCVCAPQGRPQDPVADDEVQLLQVGGGPVLQHAVPVLPVVETLGDLRGWRLLLQMASVF